MYYGIKSFLVVVDLAKGVLVIGYLPNGLYADLTLVTQGQGYRVRRWISDILARAVKLKSRGWENIIYLFFTSDISKRKRKLLVISSNWGNFDNFGNFVESENLPIMISLSSFVMRKFYQTLKFHRFFFFFFLYFVRFGRNREFLQI